MPFVPLGDPERPPGSLRIKSAPTKYPTRTDFNMDFFPIDGPTRRARRAMLAQHFFIIDDKILMSPFDPYEAKEFRRQEESGDIDLDILRANFGKKANWLTSLCFEARVAKFTREDAIKESEWHLTHAVANGSTKTLKQFHDAVVKVNKVVQSGSENIAKFATILHALAFKHDNGRLPMRHEIKAFLEKEELLPASLDAKHDGKLDHRFFKGPFLSRIKGFSPWGKDQVKSPHQ